MSVGIGITVKQKNKERHHPKFGCPVSARLRDLYQNTKNNRSVSKTKTKNALISRSHVSITVPPMILSSRRCHLSSFFQLPLFRVKRKAKPPKVEEKEVGCRCETDGRGETKDFRSSSKLTFLPRDHTVRYAFFKVQTAEKNT